MTTQDMTATATADAPADFVRVLNPARVPCWGAHGQGSCNLWIQVKFTGGRLSITGVEGPLINGDCRGSAGQCGIDPEAKPADGYTVETLARLREIWERWHLNDMRPHSPEMAALGWPEEARREIFRHEFTQTREASEARRAAEAAALAALKAGQPFNPTPAQSAAAGAAMPALCGAIRAQVSGLLDSIREAREEREELAGGYYDAAGRAAFCAGAGLQEMPA